MTENFPKKKFPEEVRFLFEIFAGEIRLVGGSVRDLLLGKKIADFDFATRFLPQEVIKILRHNGVKAVPTGLEFGTITAVVNGKNFEITTLRKDDETNGRHCKPQFVDDYFADAKRRDFTINGLYLNAEGELYDYFDGISDLKNKKVKFIGEAKQRIAEDFLRILRFFRFSCDYAARLDPQGLQACVQQKENLKKLSRERIRAEFLKLLASENKTRLVAILKILKNKKISAEIFTTELDLEGLKRLFEIEKKLKFSAALNLRIAVLFLQNDRESHPELVEGCDNLCFDKLSMTSRLSSGGSLKIFFQEIRATNREKKYLQFLNENVDVLDLKGLKRLLAFEEKNLVLDFYLFFLAKNFDSFEMKLAKKNLQFLQNFSRPDFPINGEDLKCLGLNGAEIGEAIKQAKIFWANGDFEADKFALMNLLQNHGSCG